MRSPRPIRVGIGRNIESANTCGLGAGDLKNTDPQLGPLADNGGPTKTMEITNASPAFNAAVGCPPPAIFATTALAAVIIGSDTDEVLTGTVDRDLILAHGGNDTVTADAGNDFVKAGKGNDTVDGGDGKDQIRGGADDDNLSGGLGNDKIFANQGVDTVSGGDGNDDLWALSRKDVSGDNDQIGDTLSGGAGKDKFDVRDGEKDTVDCGDGKDVVLADALDVYSADCEKIIIRQPASHDGGPESTDDE